MVDFCNTHRVNLDLLAGTARVQAVELIAEARGGFSLGQADALLTLFQDQCVNVDAFLEAVYNVLLRRQLLREFYLIVNGPALRLQATTCWDALQIRAGGFDYRPSRAELEHFASMPLLNNAIRSIVPELLPATVTCAHLLDFDIPWADLVVFLLAWACEHTQTPWILAPPTQLQLATAIGGIKLHGSAINLIIYDPLLTSAKKQELWDNGTVLPGQCGITTLARLDADMEYRRQVLPQLLRAAPQRAPLEETLAAWSSIMRRNQAWSVDACLGGLGTHRCLVPRVANILDIWQREQMWERMEKRDFMAAMTYIGADPALATAIYYDRLGV